MGVRLIDRIQLTYRDSEIYMKMKLLAEQTHNTWASYGLDPVDFWGHIKRNYGVIGGQFILDRQFIDDKLDTDDQIFAQVLWVMSSMYDNGMSDSDRTFLKMKWGFK